MHMVKAALLATKEMLVTPSMLGFLLSPPLRKATQKYYKSQPFLTMRLAGKNMEFRRNHAPYTSPLGYIKTINTPQLVDYVIQEHDAKRAGLHWDLRLHLEVECTTQRYKTFETRSWLSKVIRPNVLEDFNQERKVERRAVSFAVRKAKLPELGKPILAVRQPDHEPRYSSFEGEIPEGQYGAGSVKIVSTGKAWVWHQDENQISVDLLDNTNADKSHKFSLIRVDNDNWLWIRKKLISQEQVTKHPFKSLKETPDEQRDDTLYPEFIAEEKVDGAWAIVYVDRDPAGRSKVRAFSHRVSKRDGDLIEYTTKVPALHDGRLAKLDRGVFAVELYHPRGASYLGGLLNTKSPGARLNDKKMHAGINYKILDVLRVQAEEGEIGKWHGTEYSRRRQAMDDLSRRGLPVVERARSNETISEFYDRVTEYKDKKQVVNDGIVLKETNSIGESHWFRLKPIDTQDCEIIGFTQGDGRHSDRLGALVCQMPSGKKVNVGTGFTDVQRDHIWEHQDEYLGQVIEVDFHERKHQMGTGPRAKEIPVYYRVHPSKSDLVLKDTAEGLGVSKYQLINRK